jgi:hypothetical protein
MVAIAAIELDESEVDIGAYVDALILLGENATDIRPAQFVGMLVREKHPSLRYSTVDKAWFVEPGTVDLYNVECTIILFSKFYSVREACVAFARHALAYHGPVPPGYDWRHAPVNGRLPECCSGPLARSHLRKCLREKTYA